MDYCPMQLGVQAELKPVYETLPGWKTSTYGIRDFEKLPPNAVRYLKRLEELLNVPVDIVSTSPERDDVVFIRDLSE